MKPLNRYPKKPATISPGGSAIYQYGDPQERPFGFADVPPEWADERSAFYDRFFGKCEYVVHEVIRQIPHIDIFIYEPSQERDFCTLISSGLSDYLMIAPDEVPLEEWRVEMFMRVPKLKLKEYSSRNPWQIDSLHHLTRLPIEYDAWFGQFHTVPNGDPPKPVVRGSQLTTAILLPPMLEPEEFQEGIQFSDGTRASFFWVDLLTTGECNYKLNHGAEALLSLFERNNHPSVLNEKRRSYI